MHKIQRVGVKSVAKISFVIMFCFGLVNALFLAFSTIRGVGQVPGESQVSFILVAIAVLPFVYALVGLVTGLVFAVLYNLIAPRLGGIEIELQ